MTFKPNLLALAALYCMVAIAPASAQPVYKCGSDAATKYTDQPCPGRIVNTDRAPVQPKSERDRVEQDRLIAQSMRRLPGETADHLKIRQRRALLSETDRDECARLDTRMPVEAEGMRNPDKVQSANFEAALERSRKRFAALRC